MIPLLFFGSLEFASRVFNIELNTGEDPFEETKLFNFKLVSSKEEVDRDIFIETGPKIFSIYSGRYRCKIDERNRWSSEYIILTLGDSCTYGLGVDSNQTFSCCLENLLNSYNSNMKFRVFNFGYPGYSSFQGLIFLNKYIKVLNPNLVIIWFGANDGCYAPFYSDKEFYQRDNKMLINVHNFLYRHFKFYQLLRNINLNYFRRLVDRSFKDPLNKRFRKKRVSPSEFIDNLTKMKDICALNDCDVIFIYHCWFINNKLERHKEYCPLEPFLDLCNIYLVENAGANAFWADYCHPSAMGHRIIAEHIAEIVNDRIIK